jgi:hypothetical protein
LGEGRLMGQIGKTLELKNADKINSALISGQSNAPTPVQTLDRRTDRQASW